jgi:ketol-acid reductoisomerase
MSHSLAGAAIAVLGFGNQGEAQALNLRDAGLDVRIGLRLGGAAERRARALDFDVQPLADAVARADVAAVLLPDEAILDIWVGLVPAARPGTGFVFAHGFALLYGALAFPDRSDVVLIAPTGPGRVLRERAISRAGLPAYAAVHHDASGDAWALAEAWAEAIGCPLSQLWRTTVAEETEVDLFGEQTVLCGGMNHLVVAAFEILVERGYTPEVAYLECVHQFKYLADLLHDRGLAGFRDAISRTALYGDFTRGPRVINEESRAAMRRSLEEIRSGAFAREWLAEARAGRPRLTEWIAAGRRHPLEAVRNAALRLPAPPDQGEGESRKTLSKK